jgi:molybdopterin/thiamine biosynthesis adenylyltransferase/rhodanese-related sulfurtransferase
VSVHLTPEEVLRYSRHLLLPEVGVEGQGRLGAARVLIVGLGGLGSPASLYLAAAGIGTLGLVEFDRVDGSNLQRQVLYGTRQIGEPKIDAAAERLTDLNPHVRIERFPARLTAANARETIAGFDLVVDGSDNFPTRYLVNDACALQGKPLVYGSIFRFDGQVTVFDASRGPCYRCLHPEPPPPGLVPSCAEGGVLGVLPGVIGSLQALEALKLVLRVGDPLVGRLLLFDALRLRMRELALRKDPQCPLCGPNPTVRDLIDYEAFCGLTPPAAAGSLEISPRRAKEKLTGGGVTLLDVREPLEHELVHLEGSRLIPLGELPGRLAEIDPRAPVIVYCHHGRRSLEAVSLLRAAGFHDALSLAGGIEAWALELDPALPRY